MSRTLAVAACVAAAVSTAAVSTLGAADQGPVTFAVLRGDGILIPFAIRNGSGWRNPWPVPDKRVDVPIDFGDVPKTWWGRPGPSRAWHAWFADGKTATATVDKATWYPSFCVRGVGLQTDLRAPVAMPPASTSPFPKLGLATSTPVVFERVEALNPASPEWTSLVALIAKPFGDSETRSILGLAWDFGAFPRTSRTRAGEVRLERLYRAPLPDGRTMYYFEAQRRYAEGDGRCTGVAFGTGWFAVRGTTLPRKIEVDVRLMSCDYEAAITMLPLAALIDGKRAYWFAQYSAWNAETYVVLRVDGQRAPPDIEIETPGGRCGV